MTMQTASAARDYVLEPRRIIRHTCPICNC